MNGQITDAVMSERLQELQSLIEQQLAGFNVGSIGKTFDVLFEKAGRHPGQIVGRSPYLQPVHVTGASDLIGKVARIDITDVTAYSLHGSLSDVGIAESDQQRLLATAEA
jgi:tRNA-2-methylthio-N6-dimethylallyladenosine synthase